MVTDGGWNNDRTKRSRSSLSWDRRKERRQFDGCFCTSSGAAPLEMPPLVGAPGHDFETARGTMTVDAGVIAVYFGDAVFVDGFESGDTMAWSSTTN